MKRLATYLKAAAASTLLLFAFTAAPLAGVGDSYTVFGKSSNTGPDGDVLDATVYGKSSNTGPDGDVLDATVYGKSSNTGPDGDVLD